MLIVDVRSRSNLLSAEAIRKCLLRSAESLSYAPTREIQKFLPAFAVQLQGGPAGPELHCGILSIATNTAAECLQE
jgi:hypothetical protein